MMTMGSKAVAGKGTASVIHHTAIQAASPATDQASGDSPSGGDMTTVTRNSRGPSTMPMRRARRTLYDGGSGCVTSKTGIWQYWIVER